jgi:N-sulfoglucosamine sulfohydrolase
MIKNLNSIVVIIFWLFQIIILFVSTGCNKQVPHSRPNILICIADDASHMGDSLKWLSTPAFNTIAAKGVRFINAFTPNAKCAPSRACLLTGRNSWQLKEAANHFNNFPSEFKTFPEVLKEFGYYTGHTGKGWGPGNPGTLNNKKRELTGRAFNEIKISHSNVHISNNNYAANFIDFYKNKPDNKPFCFWYGGYEPHRRYEFGSSLTDGKKTTDINRIPEFWPDNDSIRIDILDYALEIEYFDSHVEKMLNFLEENGDLENTLVIITSDHGMPFPRVKSDAYYYSNHIPLAMMWESKIRNPNRIIDAYVSFIDIAPTILDAAGISWNSSGMKHSPGQNLMSILTDNNSQQRDYVLIGKERHDVGRPDDYGYPIRGIIKDNWLYLMNYRPDLWPAGNPECGYTTVDGSPTKTVVLSTRYSLDERKYWEWSFGKRPEEELYNLGNDKSCIHNLASSGDHAAIKSRLRKTMEEDLKIQEDPRMFGNGDIFHTYEYTWEIYRNLYNKMVIQNEEIVPVWINSSDIEKEIAE